MKVELKREIGEFMTLENTRERLRLSFKNDFSYYLTVEEVKDLIELFPMFLEKISPLNK
jgi:hypothetical protein